MDDSWTIAEVARRAGITPRTLRHYDRIGLLPAGREAGNGYRRYDAGSLVRLQRILLLRGLGLGLAQIAAVLERETDEVRALTAHLGWLRQEQDRLARQIAAVEATVAGRERGEGVMTDRMFDGFDHTAHRQEVEERWGAEAYARGDAWWRGMPGAERTRWQQTVAQLGADWADAAARGVAPDSAEAQALADRHIAWLAGIPGTPAEAGQGVRGYVLGLADLYVADPRFAAAYGGEAGATFVRDTLRRHYA